MHFIEHIVEPTKLLLLWQPPIVEKSKRYVVAELIRSDNNNVSLKYLLGTPDLEEAKQYGFDGYPAFPDLEKEHHNVIDAFMRRLPPRERSDINEYLEGLRLRPDVKISDFALLGYSGARLLSDNFSIIHPFYNADGPCELLLEAAGYRHLKKDITTTISVNSPAHFKKEFYEEDKEDAIGIYINDQKVGNVTRGLIPTFSGWIDSNRISEAFVEKINGSSIRPILYLYVKLSPVK